MIVSSCFWGVTEDKTAVEKIWRRQVCKKRLRGASGGDVREQGGALYGVDFSEKSVVLSKNFLKGIDYKGKKCYYKLNK